MKKKIKKIIHKIDSIGRKSTKLNLKYLLSGGGWRVSGDLISISVSFLLSIAFANLLSDKSFGIYTYIISLAGSLSFLTLGGMSIAITQAVARGYDTALITAVKIQQKWNSIYTLGLLAIASYYLFKDNYLFASSLAIIAFTAPFTQTYQSYNSFLLGKKDFKRNALYNIIKNLFRLTVIISVILITKSILALIIAYALSTLLPSIYFYFKTKKTFSISPKNDLKKDRSLFKFGLNLSFVNVLTSIANNIDSIILFQLIGPAQLATYTFAKKASETGKGLVKSSLSIYIPKLANRKLEDIRSVFLFRLAQTIIIGIALTAALIIIIPFIFQYFFPKYPDAIFYAQLLSLSLILIVPNSYMGYIFSSHKMLKPLYINNISTSVTRIIGFAILGLLFGIIGIVIAKLISDLVLFVVSIFTFKSTKFHATKQFS